MSEFRTVINRGSSAYSFGLNQPVLTVGSCFANSIGSRLQKHKIPTCSNPFGTVYNPHSIHKLIGYAIRNEPVPNQTFLQNQEVYLNYDFHSEFSSLTQVDLSQKISSTIGLIHDFLKNTEWLIITYGTAWAYERNDTGELVANCHKMPAGQFTKSLLTQKKVIESFKGLYRDLKTFNPNVKIILTVSPVRHIKDTLELNSVSKSVLRLSCYALTSSFTDVEYFPAYEIMLDDLRDYRFYKSDMIHPTEEAEEYIWRKFIDRYADSELKNFLREWSEILTALGHKAFHPSSSSHQLFLKQTLKKLELLKPLINVDSEINSIQNQLLSC